MTKKEFDIEFDTSWVFGSILAIISGLFLIYEHKITAFIFGFLSIICFLIAIYFRRAKPKQPIPKITIIDLDDEDE